MTDDVGIKDQTHLASLETESDQSGAQTPPGFVSATFIPRAKGSQKILVGLLRGAACLCSTCPGGSCVHR